MIVLDANILLYAYDAASPQHAKARAWIEEAFSSVTPIGLPWQSIGAFLRVITNSKLPGQRFTLDEGAQIVDRWLDQPNVLAISPGEHYWPLFRETMIAGQARVPLLSGAQLAALTIEFGGVLYTTDRDFARFPGLRWINPLA
jgi:uncharacterized protein